MQKNVGIWGFGAIGKSALNFFSKLEDKKQITVWDNRNLCESEVSLIKESNAKLMGPYCGFEINDFIHSCDYILVSPGIDLRNYHNQSAKFYGELDLFSKLFKKPSIAITGTLGKTTTTKLFGTLFSILPNSKDFFYRNNSVSLKVTSKIVLGGNGWKDLLEICLDKKSYDLAVLELSSFQLDLNSTYSPDIAIWTNFYPNHLDRHISLENYFDAKFKLVSRQKEDQFLFMPKELFFNELMQKNLNKIKSQTAVVCMNRPTEEELNKFRFHKTVFFYIEDKTLFFNFEPLGFFNHRILSLENMPTTSFVENWSLVLSCLFILGKDLSLLEEFDWNILAERFGKNLVIKEHRLEYCLSLNGVDFYNDSKSTIIEATKAAVEKLSLLNKPIILILGGVSKGVCRIEFFNRLKDNKNISTVIAFGEEARLFNADFYFDTLEAVFAEMSSIAKPGTIVLFSPSGASFDLFENYQKRGERFKDLLKDYANKRGKS